jgi:hypothetical protein
MIIWDRATGLVQSWSGDKSAAMLVNFKELLNLGYKDLLLKFNGEETEDVRTTSTQIGARAIKLAPNYIRMHTVTATVGSQTYDLVEEESQDRWAERLYLNRNSTRPEVYYLRPRFGVGGTELLLDPIPSTTSTIITINYAANARDLGVDAYSTGTAAVTTSVTTTQTITGTGTTWTAAMVGRYFKVNDTTGDGNWYRIIGYTSPTVLTIENKYDGLAVSGVSYQIAEIFSLPEDMHMLPLYYTMMHYYLGYRQDEDEKRLALWEARYKTGLKEAETRYKRKGKSSVLREKAHTTGWPVYPGYFPENAG